jgi:hypothetical protein
MIAQEIGFFDIMFSQSNLISAIINVICGVFSSCFAIYLVFRFLKPKIRVSNFISKITENGKIYYQFKIVNVDWFFNANEIYVELKLVQVINNSLDIAYNTIKLNTDKVPFLPTEREGKNNFNDHAAKFMIEKGSVPFSDFDKELKGSPNFIIMRISAKHSMSGITKIFNKKYGYTSIKEGNFQQGTLCGIE